MDTKQPSLNSWIQNFLAVRSCNQPDGRPLFAYKTTSNEYQQLRVLLTNCAVTQAISETYSQAWLLYASEWWRREYAGGAWKWEPVFDALGRTAPPQQEKQRAVMVGRRQWRLTTELTDGKKYIGQVAINGGLPMRLLEGAQGSLSRILKMVLEDAVHYSLDQNVIYAEIEKQASLLPISYRQSMVYELLSQIIQAVISLRSSFLSDIDDDPIATLHQQCPDWETHFPLTLESTAASSLIRGLVTTAAAASSRSQGTPFQMVRGLRFPSTEDEPTPEIIFQMRSRARRQDIADALNIGADSIPPSFQLLLRIDAKEYLAGEGFLRDDQVHLVAKQLRLPNTLGHNIHLIISRYGVTLSTVNLPGGDELDENEPWVFEDSFPFAMLIGHGDATVRGQAALALLPQKAIVFSEGADSFTYVKDSCLDDKALIRLPLGKTRATYKKQSFSITVSESAAASVQAYWQGITLEATSTPATIFLGLPNIRYAQTEATFGYAPRAELFQRVAERETSFSAGQPAYGICTLLWRKNNQILMRTRAIVLPKDSAIQYQPGKTPYEGSIRLRNWPDSPTVCDTDGVNLNARYDGNDLHLKLNNTTGALIPEVTLRIKWPGGEQRICLPFPGRGAVLLSATGQVLPRNSVCSIEELTGCRALLLPNPDDPTWYIKLSSGTTTTGRLEQTLRFSNTRETRLFELMEPIRALMSCYTALDHQVSVEFINGHDIHNRLSVGRYSTQIRIHKERDQVSLSDGATDIVLDDTELDGLLFALPVQHPEQDPIALAPHTSEGVFTGSWLADLPTDPAGPWLIHTQAGSRHHSRPAILSHSIARADSTGSVLRSAIGEPNQEARSAKLKAALNEMALEPEHPDWLVLEDLIAKLGHLPLSSIDIWSALIQSPKALVMAFLHADGFAEMLAARLPTELPQEWLLVPPQIWLAAFAALSACYSSPGKERRFRLLKGDINKKKELIVHLQPGLKFIFQQNFYHYFEQLDQEVELYLSRSEMVLNLWFKDLFEGENSKLQKLMRRSSEQDWPTTLKDKAEAYASTPEGRQICLHFKLPANDFKTSVILLPFLIAQAVVRGNGLQWQQNPQRLFQVRLYRQFDSAWFDDAYVTGLAYAMKDSK